MSYNPTVESSLSKDILPSSSRESSKPLIKVGLVSTLAGSIKGNVDGQGQNAQFSNLTFGCFNPLDNCLYVSDSYNNTIRKVTEQGYFMQRKKLNLK